MTYEEEIEFKYMAQQFQIAPTFQTGNEIHGYFHHAKLWSFLKTIEEKGWMHRTKVYTENGEGIFGVVFS